jgi:hypothetical protein
MIPEIVLFDDAGRERLASIVTCWRCSFTETRVWPGLREEPAFLDWAFSGTPDRIFSAECPKCLALIETNTTNGATLAREGANA